MSEEELQNYLLLNYPKENESCEWKEFKSLKHSVSGKESDDIISYISAISNMEGGHLVIGVKDDTLEIVGLENKYHYTAGSIPLKILKQCPNLSSEGFEVEEFITEDSLKTIWIFLIPKHKLRQPVLAHNKAWQRVKDSLVEMRQERLDAILHEQIHLVDWSSVIIPEATIDDLDLEAINFARDKYKIKNPQKVNEIDSWDDGTFLDKAKITIKGRITRTAIILLGKPESEVLISPAVLKIRWILYDSKDNKKDYQIESCPFLLSIEKLYHKIRNVKYRYLKDGTLFPDEVLTYEPFTIREAINNCIAHQDYSKSGMIDVAEREDQLEFSNIGSFIPGSIERVIIDNAPEKYYRNQFLCNAMVNLNMVDTIGSGIIKMFNFQRNRFFPLPDYDFSNGQVKVKIIGKVIDIEYARILAKNQELTLAEIMILDKVQKKKELTNDEERHLRKRNLVEGRKPNFYLSAEVAQKTGQKAEYIKTRGLKDAHFKKLILELIDKYHETSKEEIDKLLMDLLPGVLNEQQRKNKIRNLVYSMSKKDKTIENLGSNRYPKWIRKLGN